jgi:DNA repair protein RadD
MRELIDAGFLSTLVRPVDVIATRIDTSDIKTTSGDFNLHDLAERVETYLDSAADEAVRLAVDRKKWIAFLPSVENAFHYAQLLRDRGIGAVVVCGSTPKDDRAKFIARFRAGEIRCLVTVLALSTGFDVPDVDCIVWLRPTKSPVLYVQGAGRGMRIAPGKENCLWIDFSDTTDRLGPVDVIKGRKKRANGGEQGAPYRICDNCGEHVSPPSLLVCPTCGAERPPTEEEIRAAKASAAAILSAQIKPRIDTYVVRRVTYELHKKQGSPDSLRVVYWGGILAVATEWVCLDHAGFAKSKADRWWRERAVKAPGAPTFVPGTHQALEWIKSGYKLREPSAVTVNSSGKYPEIVRFEWGNENEQSGAGGRNLQYAPASEMAGRTTGELHDV